MELTCDVISLAVLGRSFTNIITLIYWTFWYSIVIINTTCEAQNSELQTVNNIQDKMFKILIPPHILFTTCNSAFFASQNKLYLLPPEKLSVGIEIGRSWERSHSFPILTEFLPGIFVSHSRQMHWWNFEKKLCRILSNILSYLGLSQSCLKSINKFKKFITRRCSINNHRCHLKSWNFIPVWQLTFFSVFQ